MAFEEITKAIEWAGHGATTKWIPMVQGYMSLHNGLASPGDPAQHSAQSFPDQVWYARGALSYVGPGIKPNQAAHLAGVLDHVWAAKASLGGDMGDVSSAAVPVEKRRTMKVRIYADGTATYQHLLHGTPVGGMPPTPLTGGKDVGGELVTFVSGNQVITFGVALDKWSIPQ